MNLEIKKYLDVGDAKVNVFDFVRPGIDLKNQINILREDMGWLEYQNGKFVVDFGWKPEFSINGEFIVYVIKDQDWDSPLKVLRCNSINQFLRDMQSCIDLARNSE